MNWFSTIIVFLTAFLAVFWEAAFNALRHWVGAQIDLLPALMVYVALSGSIGMVASFAVLGGLWFDSLSANPLGVTVLPLFLIGLAIYANRELILRDETFAQFVLGLAASSSVPIMILLFLLTTGHEPLFGWGTIWQLIVMSLGGAIATPIFFEFFNFVNRVLGPRTHSESSFRPDREIRRGR
jgi:cell shape-determining protein MreD